MSKLKGLLAQKINVGHFIIALILMIGLAIVLFILSGLLGWLCCMEPPAGPRMFSNWTLFGIFTIDFLILALGLIGLYRFAEMKHRLDYQKSYLIMGLVLVIVYLIFMPTLIIMNP